MSGHRNLCDELTSLIHSKNIKRLSELVQQGADLNMALSEGLVPLVLAANNGDIEMCQALISLGARQDCNKGILSHDTPLSIAVRAGLDNAVATLIELGSNVNMTIDLCGGKVMAADPFHLYPGSTVLQLAVFRRNIPIMRLLLDAGAEVNRADCAGNTALHLACLDMSGNDSTVRLLLSLNKGTRAACRRTDIDARNCLGQTPLMLAASHSAEMTKLILGAIPPPLVNATDKSEKTALHYAVETGSEETVLLLLRAGCFVDGTDVGKRYLTPLHSAVRHGQTTFCEILIEAGADMLALTHSGDSVLHQAAECPRWSDSFDLLHRFIDAGVSVDARNSFGCTALALAAECGNLAVVMFLIDVGANMNVINKHRMTALASSIASGHPAVAQLLIVEGASPNVGMLGGSLKLAKRSHWAALRKQLPIFRLLVQCDSVFASSHLALFRQSFGDDAVSAAICSDEPTDDEILNAVVGALMTPRSLKDRCRQVIRSSVAVHHRGAGIVRHILLLPLPRSLQSYLCYVDEVPQSYLGVSDDDSSTD